MYNYNPIVAQSSISFLRYTSYSFEKDESTPLINGYQDDYFDDEDEEEKVEDIVEEFFDLEDNPNRTETTNITNSKTNW